MMGSLISAQLCPSRATEEQTGCQQTQNLFADAVMSWCLCTFCVSTRPHVLSAGGVEARFCTLKLLMRVQMVASRLCSVRERMALDTASGLRKRARDQTTMTISG